MKPGRRLPVLVEGEDEQAARASWGLSRRMLQVALWSTLSLGATFGAYNLLAIHLALGPVPPAHNWVHATFQVLGFVLLSVMGVAYQVAPRSCGAALRPLWLARASFGLVVAALVLRGYGQFGRLLPATAPALLLGGVAALGAVAAFAVVLVATFRAGHAPIRAPGMAGVAAGTLWWLVAAALLVAAGVRGVRAADADLGAHYNEAFYIAALLGAAVSWVQGMVRKVGPSLLGLASPRRRVVAVAFALSQLGAAVATVGAALPGTARGAAAFDVGLIASALGMALFIVGASVFETAPETRRLPLLAGAAPAVRRAARGAFAGASLFALLGAAYGVMDLAGQPPPPALWDGARHALALGCLTPLILALASHLVPVFAGVPLRRTAWRDAGLVLIAVGLVGRELQVPAFLLVMPRLLWLSGSSGIVAAVGVALAAGSLLGPLRSRGPMARPQPVRASKAA